MSRPPREASRRTDARRQRGEEGRRSHKAPVNGPSDNLTT